MMAGRIAYGLIPGVAILLAVGAALGQGIEGPGDPHSKARATSRILLIR